MLLWKEVADQYATWCCTSASRDYEEVTRRVENEGLSFLTITLPNLCKDFEKALADEQVTPSLFVGFKKRGSLPLFLGGFFELVFDPETAVLRQDCSIEAIRAIRQLTLMYGKILLPTSEERNQDASKHTFEPKQMSSILTTLVKVFLTSAVLLGCFLVLCFVNWIYLSVITSSFQNMDQAKPQTDSAETLSLSSVPGPPV